MSSLFRIEPEKKAAGSADAPAKWARLGLTSNPFPESGVLGDVIYSAHMPDLVNKITQWLNDIAHKHVGEPRGPFALEGTIGAGKTHLLSHMERALTESSTAGSITVVRENLVNAGGGRLLLSTLFGGNLKLGEIAEGVLKAPTSALKKAIDKLPSASPLRPVMSSEVSADTLALWLRGATLTRAQSHSIGGRTLDAEGERLRAVIHLLRLAAQLNQLTLVVLLLDQLEDLERKAEVTPLRRARFLTDLRIFIDEGLEGAPIALCMAWNTEGAQFMRSINAQYPALASRLSTRVTVPALPQGHLVPFAQEYLNHAYKHKKQRGLIFDARIAASLTSSLTPLPGGDVPPREWLDQLRKWADREAQKAH
jgi:hypothetical protein